MIDHSDLLSDLSDLDNQLVNSLLNNFDDMFLGFGWSSWSWFWSDSWFESNSSDDMSDVNDLLVDLSNDSSQFDDFLSDSWFIII